MVADSVSIWGRQRVLSGLVSEIERDLWRAVGADLAGKLDVVEEHMVRATETLDALEEKLRERDV